MGDRCVDRRQERGQGQPQAGDPSRSHQAVEVMARRRSSQPRLALAPTRASRKRLLRDDGAHPVAGEQPACPPPLVDDGSTGTAAPTRIFLLSPASCSGTRARLVMSDRAGFELARQLRSPQGAPLGSLFALLSGLYFRGKLAYGRAFARPPRGLPGLLVITAGEGLLSPEELMTPARLRAFAAVRIDTGDSRYRLPLIRDIERLASSAGPDCELVLLGSIATGKYVDILLPILGDRLRFPLELVGRGDMSRGGLLLRCARDGRELTYVRVSGAPRHGPRPPRLEPLTGRAGASAPPPISRS